MESVLHETVREQLAPAARGSRVAARVGGRVQPLQRQLAEAMWPLLWSTVIRGCIQVVLWGWVPGGEGEVLGGAGAGGIGEQLMRRLVQAGGGSVRGVSVQVGQEVAVLGDPTLDMQLPGVMPMHGGSGGGRGSRTSVRLLEMFPPAASLPAVAASGSLTVRLLLHSPTPQPARVLVLAERQGAASNRAVPSGGMPGGGVLSQPLLLELPVQLEGGVQEVDVEVALGVGDLAGESGVREASAAASAFRVVMVGPEHAGAATGGQQQAGAAAAHPLVHWVAPPLLLLPPAAAAEVCGAWGAVQQEAGGGLAQEEQEGERQEQHHYQQQQEEVEEQAGVEGLAPHTGALPPSGSSSELLASAERRSSLWWSHMAPLLGDLAHALGGHQGQGQDGGHGGRGPRLVADAPAVPTGQRHGGDTVPAGQQARGGAGPAAAAGAGGSQPQQLCCCFHQYCLPGSGCVRPDTGGHPRQQPRAGSTRRLPATCAHCSCSSCAW